jgi:predicted ABC-type transport system involved in lysophospholipase L1 biosynthesis ATPase subunit
VTSALEALGLTRILPGPQPTTLIADVDVSFEPKSFTVITGPSGSGKSSLLYLLGLLDPPTAGDVLVNGCSTRALGGEERALMRLSRFGFVFQFHFLLPELTVLDNVMLPMRQHGRLDSSEMRERAQNLLDPLGMTAEGRKRPGELSGGQRQRAAIARARQRSAVRSGRRADRRARFEERRGGVRHLPGPRRRGPHRDRGHPRRIPRPDREPGDPYRGREDRGRGARFPSPSGRGAGVRGLALQGYIRSSAPVL